MQTKKIHYIILFFLIMLSSCIGRHSSSEQVLPISVRTIVIEPQTKSNYSHYVGSIESAHEIPLSVQVAGRVLSVECREGEWVKRGQVLIVMDTIQCANALRSAKATLLHAQDAYERVVQVHAQGGVADQKMVELESQLQQAQSLYDMALQQLRECRLEAPCDGRVSGFSIQEGQTLVPGVHLFSLLDMSSLVVRFAVPETEISSINIGDVGEMECIACDTVLPITVTEKQITANLLTHTYDALASIKGGEHLLMQGMVAKVKLFKNKEGESSIVVPASCVRLMPNKTFIWTIEQGRAVARTIEVKGYTQDGVLVSGGLNIGDTIVVEGYQKLYKDCSVVVQ